MSEKLTRTGTTKSRYLQASVVMPSGVKRLIPTEVCETIIDFVAVRWDEVSTTYSGDRTWDYDVHATLGACALTCRAWRPRSQLHLMRVMSVRASNAGTRSFADMRTLFQRIPRLQSDVESLSIDGEDLEVPRFHLVPLVVYDILPRLPILTLCGGLIYMPTFFRVTMRRFVHLTHLRLHKATFASANDFRRMVESLRHLQNLALLLPEWVPYKLDRPCNGGPWPRSLIKLHNFEATAQARWITDVRTVHLLDWISSSGAISEIRQLRLGELMLVDDNIVAAADRIVRAAQSSTKLSMVMLHFGPDVDLTPLHSPLASLPKLERLGLRFLYDTSSLSQVADCLSTILVRPKDTMHSELELMLDQYPHHIEPLTECWEKLDDTLQHDGLHIVGVDRLMRLCDPDKPVVWGDWYQRQRKDGWLADVRERFPKTCKSGRLWAMDSRKEWHYMQKPDG